MKRLKIIYWTTTSLLAVMMIASAYGYLTQKEIQQGFVYLGFPDYFRVELAVAKLLGAIVLVAPLGRKCKEWAYAGFAITFVSAFIAHTSLGSPVLKSIGPLMALMLLLISYFSRGMGLSIS
ncbi:DoxX family protein [Dyadobacter sp. CY326]|uniref:DoxX family protein n=1 Tax=Dyadobacter sp. CY326 TaxID=2907300 RepID=UPI001F1AEFB6|nr:DoxX family protein [Dyadobacter sp. CY326]MCE7065742.1 DoxX family protein [Dyadobacter sp. CY326]